MNASSEQWQQHGQVPEPLRSSLDTLQPLARVSLVPLPVGVGPRHRRQLYGLRNARLAADALALARKPNSAVCAVQSMAVFERPMPSMLATEFQVLPCEGPIRPIDVPSAMAKRGRRANFAPEDRNV